MDENKGFFPKGLNNLGSLSMLDHPQDKNHKETYIVQVQFPVWQLPMSKVCRGSVMGAESGCTQSFNTS